MTQEIEDQLYKAYYSIKPYLISRELDIKYPTICQRCVYTYHPDMITTYSIEGNCDLCKYYSRLAIVKRNWTDLEEMINNESL